MSKTNKPEQQGVVICNKKVIGEIKSLTFHEHTKEECKQVVTGTRDLLEQIKNIDDKATRDAVCESAIELCNQLIRDGKEIRK